MAEIEYATPDKFRTQLAACDETGIVANMILTAGALHAVRHLLQAGITRELAERMERDLEENHGTVMQVAAERGIPLEILLGRIPILPPRQRK